MTHRHITITKGDAITCPNHATLLENVPDEDGSRSSLYRCRLCDFFTVHIGLDQEEVTSEATRYAAAAWCWLDTPMIEELIEEEFAMGATFDDAAAVHAMIDGYAKKYDLVRP